MSTIARIVSQRRLNGDKTGVFESWFECSICRGRVQLGDRFCRSCGVRFG